MPDETKRKKTKEERRATRGGKSVLATVCEGVAGCFPNMSDHMTKGKDPGRVKKKPIPDIPPPPGGKESHKNPRTMWKGGGA